ncbi:MAG TPA: hypothetical protein VGF26_16000, partial [Ramlibacter sp.]
MTRRACDAALALVLCAGLALTGWGLHSHGLLQQLSLPEAAPARAYVAAAAVLVALCEILRIRLGFGRFAAGALVIGALAVLAGAVAPLLVVLALAAVCWVLGVGILRVLGFEDDPNDAVAITVGMACVGTVIFVFARYPVAYSAVYGAAIAVVLLAGWRSLVTLGRRLSRPVPDGSPLLEFAILLVVAYEFLVALMPEAGHDALALHLFVPGHLAWRHKWSFDAGTYAWAVIPMLADWLYGAAYVLA